MSKRTLVKEEWNKKLMTLVVLTLFWPLGWAMIYAVFFHCR